jgi:hypothetical protein
MDIKEKILLLEILMTDIRSSWDTNTDKILRDQRIWTSLKLIDEFQFISTNYEHQHYNLFRVVNWQNFHNSIGCYLTGRYEGRYLRMSICDGGYEGLELLHQLEPKFSLRSDEFKAEVKRYCRTQYDFMTE